MHCVIRHGKIVDSVQLSFVFSLVVSCVEVGSSSQQPLRNSRCTSIERVKPWLRWLQECSRCGADRSGRCRLARRSRGRCRRRRCQGWCGRCTGLEPCTRCRTTPPRHTQGLAVSQPYMKGRRGERAGQGGVTRAHAGGEAHA